MPNHDIIIIGTSAGGLEASIAIISQLPAEFPAALFVVMHMSPEEPSLLPNILSVRGALPAVHVTEGMAIEPGRIYCANPDHHLLIEPGHIHSLRGMKENGFRPAIDATLRTAARAYGPRVVGVILTGMLDDGTAGLLAVKRRGGYAIVQDPDEALYPSMPRTARRYVAVDAVLRLTDIAPMLVRLAHKPVAAPKEIAVGDTIDQEANITELDQDALNQADRLGVPVPFSCPDCGGVLMEFYDEDFLRFRCQIGHAYSPGSLIARQNDQLDVTLWAAYRAVDERATLLRRLATEAERLNDIREVQRFTRFAQRAEHQKEQLRQAFLKDASDEPMP
jgi:two-component system, chemotaxis family, protein-glutamate methylesterase/glutaminase